MLLKLFKYDFKTVIKKIAIYYIALMAAAILGRLFYELLKNGEEYLFAVIGIYIPVIMGLGFLIFAQKILCYIRFYKNMLSDEGYLTHTLPVSRVNLFLSKIMLSIVFDMLSIIVTVVVLIIIIPNFFVPVDSINWTIVQALAFLKDVEPAIIILSVILYALLSIFSDLIVYTCLDLGGIHNKHKTLFGIIYYFAFNFVYSILQSFFLVILNVNSFYKLIFEDSVITLLVSDCIILGLIVGLFFVNNFIIKKHLNLE